MVIEFFSPAYPLGESCRKNVDSAMTEEILALSPTSLSPPPPSFVSVAVLPASKPLIATRQGLSKYWTDNFMFYGSSQLCVSVSLCTISLKASRPYVPLRRSTWEEHATQVTSWSYMTPSFSRPGGLLRLPSPWTQMSFFWPTFLGSAEIQSLFQVVHEFRGCELVYVHSFAVPSDSAPFRLFVLKSVSV